MDTNTSLLFEMRMLNELRKLKPEQRKELYETLEREERLEEEALKKNPNLHVETKLAQVLGEIKDLRAEMQTLKNTSQSQSQSQPSYKSSCPISCVMCGNKAICALEDDSNDCNECSIFSSGIDWWPIIIFILIFLSLISLPGSKSRPCPITI